MEAEEGQTVKPGNHYFIISCFMVIFRSRNIQKSGEDHIKVEGINPGPNTPLWDILMTYDLIIALALARDLQEQSLSIK